MFTGKFFRENRAENSFLLSAHLTCVEYLIYLMIPSTGENANRKSHICDSEMQS